MKSHALENGVSRSFNDKCSNFKDKGSMVSEVVRSRCSSEGVKINSDSKGGIKSDEVKGGLSSILGDLVLSNSDQLHNTVDNQ